MTDQSNVNRWAAVNGIPLAISSSCLIYVVSVVGMSSLFFTGGDRADPMPGKNERQGRSANIFYSHDGSLQGRQNLNP
jgi:hypothetical protein